MRYVMMLMMVFVGCATSEPATFAVDESFVEGMTPAPVKADALAALMSAAGPSGPIEECRVNCSAGTICCRDVDRTVWWCYPWICLAGDSDGKDSTTTRN